MIKTKEVNVNEYKPADDGRFGKTLERCLTCKGYVKPAGKVDRWIDGNPYEIKQGAGHIEGIIKASSRLTVIFVPVPIAHADGTINVYEQEGFVMKRDAFLQALEEAGAIRDKASTASYQRGNPEIDSITIQTFYNRMRMKPHGRLLDRILDAMYKYCDMTLEELLEG